MQTRAAMLHEVNAPLSVQTLDLAPPGAGDVLVRVQAAGVCHSDWHVAAGDTRHALPVVLGHEGAGVVEAVGSDVTRSKPGDRVVLNWAPSCGRCFYCVNGRPNLCATYLEPIWAGTLLDGSPRLSLNGRPVYHFCGLACFAQYTVVPQQCCVPMADDVPATVAALIGCAVTTGVGAAIHTARVRPGASVAVFGAGGVGLSVIMGAKLAGATTIVAIDRTPRKGRTALDLGATHALVAGPGVGDEVRKITHGRGADFVFEAVGLPQVQEQCLGAVRPGGTVVLVGLTPMGSRTNLPGAIIARREITVAGSYYGGNDPASDFVLYADLHRQGLLPLDRLVTRTYSLDQVNTALSDMLEGAVARGVIVMA